MSPRDEIEVFRGFSSRYDRFVPDLLKESVRGFGKLKIRGAKFLIDDVEVHRGGFDELTSRESLRSWKIEGDVVAFLADIDLRNSHFIDAAIELINPLFEIVFIGDNPVVGVAEFNLYCFSPLEGFA